jgi:hypothetical protein
MREYATKPRRETEGGGEGATSVKGEFVAVTHASESVSECEELNMFVRGEGERECARRA